jgi:VWFA-related protein
MVAVARHASVVCVSLALALLIGPAEDSSGQVPQFKSGVELLAVDVQVVAPDGEPVLGLKPADFEVRIDGRSRRVASLQFLEQTSRTRFSVHRPQPGEDAPGASGAGRVRDGRIFVLAVDENSFWTGHARAANEAARLFIDRLAAEDYIGLATFPGTGPFIEPTREHHRVRDALDRIVGLRSAGSPGMVNVSPSEVFDITAGDGDALERVVARECPPTDRTCRKRVQMDAAVLAQDMATRALQSINGLRGLFQALAQLDGRKTIVLVSAGLVASDRVGGRPDIRTETASLARAAGSANTSLYVLHVDTSFLEAFSSTSTKVPTSLMRDSAAFATGLSMMAAAAGGEMFRVFTDADRVFDRVLRETSAYYLLAIEPAESDRDGKPHRIEVTVRRRGTTVRSRRSIVVAARQGPAPVPQPFRF